MSSPFPGMDPYLENDDAWQDFHDSMIPAISDALSSQVRPNYIAKIERHIFIHEPSADERVLLEHGDVSPHHRKKTSARATTEETAVAPARIHLPSMQLEKHLFVEIRDRKNREIVTVLEMLSPTNKRSGPDREQYLAKRGNLLRGTAHFIEIDLLRGWPRMPMEPKRECDYCIIVSRAEDRPEASFWPLQLRDRLPKIPVPLRAASADAWLDLQEVLDGVYDRACYSDYVYEEAPTPRLNRKDAAWAKALLRKQG